MSVSNDLLTDNRVDKICKSLGRAGYEVVLIGRKRRKSLEMNHRPYRFIRMRLLFETNFLFYAELNIRLFFKLLFSKVDLLWANDLDTLWANFLVSKIRRKKLMFDSHEHFTEVPELKYNKMAKRFWKFSEGFILPRLENVVTVCEPIARHFKESYGKDSTIIRNIPEIGLTKKHKTREDLGMPLDKPVLIWQGGGCNIERGMEELVEAMEWVDAILYIIGDGDLYDELKDRAKDLNLSSKIRFPGRLSFDDMIQYTFNADIGLSLDKDTNLNYAISLPNKLFEYIHANIPILITPLSEIKPIIEAFDIGEFFYSHKPIEIAKTINSLIEEEEKRRRFIENTYRAKKELSWEMEEEKLFDLLNKIN